jgi:hypothetical protein
MSLFGKNEYVARRLYEHGAQHALKLTGGIGEMIPWATASQEDRAFFLEAAAIAIAETVS